MKQIWVYLCFASLLAAERVPGVYIVELAGKPAISAKSKGGLRAAVAERDNVRAAQLRARNTLEQQGATVVGSVSMVANALIVKMPDDKADRLRAAPGVVGVHQARLFYPKLDHALPLMKVPDAWNLVGGDAKAGAGIKIGILDTGIDNTHPGFQDPSLPIPAGFPKVTRDIDAGTFTNNKVIVARFYDGATTPKDNFGHGTAVAMIAAGVRNTGPLATIEGVAPKAYLGNYKISAGSSGAATDADIMRALDDAVADGMDVVNFSFGDVAAPRPQDDPLVQAIETAAASGLIVTTAGGNEGPDPNTADSPGTAPSALSVGATTNDRMFASSVMVDSLQPQVAIPGDGPNPTSAITGPLKDVAAVDPSGLACNPLPAGSLTGSIALILRGTCTFEEKLNNAQTAGAVAAIIYTSADQPDAVGMATGSATLPATMVSYQDGLAIKQAISANPKRQATINFQAAPFPETPNQVASFSSAGPSSDLSIKPDLMAVGTDVYTATETGNDLGMMFDPSGYTTESGTSFSSPMVAGAAAVLKAARPSLTVQQYRSLLINTATVLTAAGTTNPLPVQQTGGGLLNLAAAVQSTVTALPASVSFGSGGSTLDLTRTVQLTNIGTAADTFSVSVSPIGNGPAPVATPASVQLAPGGTQAISLRFSGTGLPAGTYQGEVQVKGAFTAIHVPYWFAVPSNVPSHLTVLFSDSTDPAGRFTPDAIEFRVTDASGLPIPNANPTVTVVSGGGSVTDVLSIDDQVPGAYSVNVMLGPSSGHNVFRIQAGDLTQDVTIVGLSVTIFSPHP